jgi:hypothetical protein
MKPSFFAAALIALTAAACNTQAPQASAPPPAPGTVSYTPSTFQMPEGSDCKAAIARYRAVQDNDLSMGHVARSVYKQIQREIVAAESACAAGRDAQAKAMITASEQRHGYPTGL